MQKIGFVTISLFIALVAGCGHVDKTGEPQAQPSPPLTGEARILQSWQGDYPLARLDLLPEKQRGQGVGFINDPIVFKAVWQASQPGEDLPEIDFENHLVLFARNTQFYNRIRIGKIDVKDGVAEVLAMETMSAMPIEDNVALSLVVVAREGITGILSGQAVIPLN